MEGSGRKIRRCAQKFYGDDLVLNIHNTTAFDLCEKVHSVAFNKDDAIIRIMQPEDVTLQYMMKSGANTPMVIREGKPLGLRIPDPSFTVKDIERLVGSARKVDVLDVGTQKALQMTMHQWTKYFMSDKRDTLLNVISLEFSHTQLCALVSPPDVVKQLDWVETAWPQCLKLLQNVGSNNIAKMKYPKVQKYCLMSVRGSYTDFHLDFGGTSVWYHIVRGAKIFWMIPPTEENLSKFVKWTLAGKQSYTFFGDQVDKCYRVFLDAGNTFFLPGGWIHAVYTPKESLVFGGNFLHSYNILGQMQVTAIEEIIKVESRYLYPYFVEMTWFVAEKYHRNLKYMEVHGKDGKVLLVHEAEGLHLLISRLEESGKYQAAIPAQITHPKLLLEELRDLLQHTEVDTICGDFAEPIISIYSNVIENDSPKKLYNTRLISTSRPFQTSTSSEEEADNILQDKRRRSVSQQYPPDQKRRRRCGFCTSCTQHNCGQCSHCQDMKCFGGPNIRHQSCKLRMCINQTIQSLGSTKRNCCCICFKDDSELDSLLTCSECKRILHWRCQEPALPPSTNEWLCVSCGTPPRAYKTSNIFAKFQPPAE